MAEEETHELTIEDIRAEVAKLTGKAYTAIEGMAGSLRGCVGPAREANPERPMDAFTWMAILTAVGDAYAQGFGDGRNAENAEMTGVPRYEVFCQGCDEHLEDMVKASAKCAQVAHVAGSPACRGASFRIGEARSVPWRRSVGERLKAAAGKGA